MLEFELRYGCRFGSKVSESEIFFQVNLYWVLVKTHYTFKIIATVQYCVSVVCLVVTGPVWA